MLVLTFIWWLRRWEQTAPPRHEDCRGSCFDGMTLPRPSTYKESVSSYSKHMGYRYRRACHKQPPTPRFISATSCTNGRSLLRNGSWTLLLLHLPGHELLCLVCVCCNGLSHGSSFSRSGVSRAAIRSSTNVCASAWQSSSAVIKNASLSSPRSPPRPLLLPILVRLSWSPPLPAFGDRVHSLPPAIPRHSYTQTSSSLFKYTDGSYRARTQMGSTWNQEKWSSCTTPPLRRVVTVQRLESPQSDA